jgi:cell division protein FtsB
MSDIHECSICCMCYNKTTRAKVECLKCNYTACRTCLGTYIINSTNLVPDCPNCHKEWTREFMLQFFTKKFINTDLKQHREDLLYQRERALLPLRQTKAEERKNLARIHADIKSIDNEIELLHQQRDRLAEDYNRARYRYSNSDATAERRTFIQKCPGEDCRGFLSTQWKCGLCDKWTCSDCHEIKGDTRTAEHVCDPDKLATAKLIEKETKPCPKCGVRLFKISGCDQMWCTSCNDCAFSWTTGKIETTIHNPHFFEYQRRVNNGVVQRQPGDNPCGGGHAADINENVWTIRRNVTIITAGSKLPLLYSRGIDKHIDFLGEIIRTHVHIRQAVMPRYRIDPVMYNEEYGIDFLNGEITEHEFKTRLQRADKRMQHGRETTNVLEMVTATISDIVGRFNQLIIQEQRNLPITSKEVHVGIYERIYEHFKILYEIFPLLDYSNECLSNIDNIYGYKTRTPLALDIDNKTRNIEDLHNYMPVFHEPV